MLTYEQEAEIKEDELKPWQEFAYYGFIIIVLISVSFLPELLRN